MAAGWTFQAEQGQTLDFSAIAPHDYTIDIFDSYGLSILDTPYRLTNGFGGLYFIQLPFDETYTIAVWEENSGRTDYSGIELSLTEGGYSVLSLAPPDTILDSQSTIRTETCLGRGQNPGRFTFSTADPLTLEIQMENRQVGSIVGLSIDLFDAQGNSINGPQQIESSPSPAYIVSIPTAGTYHVWLAVSADTCFQLALQASP